MYRQQLAQLIAEQIDLLIVREHLNGDARNGRVIRRADSQGFDVVALAGKQARNLGKHAGFVVHQNGQGTSYCAVHVHPSFNR